MRYRTRESSNVNLFIQSEACLKITVCLVLVCYFDDSKERKSGRQFIPRVHWKIVLGFFASWILGATRAYSALSIYISNISKQNLYQTTRSVKETLKGC